jgi:four helix bundle protein
MGSQPEGPVRRNRNRGYQQLRVWQDAITLYRLASGVFQQFPYELRRVAGQNIASADSVHRNIAEGYCRRSIREYVQHLYVALGSLGETVSGFRACLEAEQISAADFERLDAHAFRLENGLLRLVQSLEEKRDEGDWIDTMVIRDGNALYDVAPD